MKSLHLSIIIASILSAHNTVCSPKISIEQIVESSVTLANDKITDVLAQQVPRLSYTGLAFFAGTAGICTSYNGVKLMCRGLEDNKKKTTVTGAVELSVGLSTTAASIITIYLLWKR